MSRELRARWGPVHRPPLRAELGEKRPGQHEAATQKAPGGDSLGEHDAAADRGKDGLQTKDYRDVSWGSLPLSDDLERVGHPNRKRPRVDDGQGRSSNPFERDRLRRARGGERQRPRQPGVT